MTRLLTAASVVCLLGTTVVAFAQAPDYLDQNRDAYRAYARQSRDNGVLANGRCGGISYGTGARSCGTATGGPVGGLNSGN